MIFVIIIYCITNCYLFKAATACAFYLLGRATLENGSKRNSAVNNNGTEIRITTNPLNANYCEPEDCLATSFSNPTHIELPSRSTERGTPERQVDSRTYCKNKKGGGADANSNSINDDLQIWYVQLCLVTIRTMNNERKTLLIKSTKLLSLKLYA